jgi:hypothetical protein
VILTAAPPGRAFTAAGWARTSPRRSRSRPASLPLANRRNPNVRRTASGQYYAPFTPYKSPVAAETQVPGHWQEPGYARPNFGRYAAPYGRKVSESAQPKASPRSAGGLPESVTPREEEDYSPEPSPGNTSASGKRTSGMSAERKRQASGPTEVVDPEALWQ